MEGKGAGEAKEGAPTDADNLDLHAAQCERQTTQKTAMTWTTLRCGPGAGRGATHAAPGPVLPRAHVELPLKTVGLPRTEPSRVLPASRNFLDQPKICRGRRVFYTISHQERVIIL